MTLRKYVFKPGINKEGTNYSNEGGWFDADKVRFRKGRPERIGGWEKLSTQSFIGTSRKIFVYRASGGTNYITLGTHQKFYVLEGNVFSDVTPIRATTTNGIVFAATNGSTTITATDNAHGAVQGDFVTLAGAASLGGAITAAVLNQEYQITGVATVDTFTFTATATANSSDSGNGGSGADAAYQINVGLDVYVPSTGWGAGTWGSGTWGSASAISETGQLRLWSHDAFGEDLIFNPRAGGIYYWDESGGTGNRAVAIDTLSGANLAPTLGLQTIVSDVDRHVIVLGADPIVGSARSGAIDPLLVAFSDQESATQWEPTATNTAGSLRLSSGSQIVGGLRSRQELLIWTDTALYSMQFIGAPFTFGINLVNENVGLISPNGMVNAPDGIYWMARDGFYTYTGSVKRLVCSVLNYVLDDINNTQSFKTLAFTNREFNEVGWFYVSSSSEEIDSYVTYNYLEGAWSIGKLSRTAWMDDGVFEKPRATGKDSDGDGYLYIHESTDDDDGQPMDNVFIESGDIDIEEGNQLAFISRIIPDIKFFGTTPTEGQINFVLKTRNFPGDSLTTNSTSNITSTTQQAFTRARGRQLVLRIQSDDDAAVGSRTGFKWRSGANRIDVRTDGRR